MCRGLKRPLERVLAGLLETDDRNRWSYEAFFKESRALTSRPPIYVFSLSMASIDRLYVASPHVTWVIPVANENSSKPWILAFFRFEFFRLLKLFMIFFTSQCQCQSLFTWMPEKPLLTCTLSSKNLFTYLHISYLLDCRMSSRRWQPSLSCIRHVIISFIHEFPSTLSSLQQHSHPTDILMMCCLIWGRWMMNDVGGPNVAGSKWRPTSCRSFWRPRRSRHLTGSCFALICVGLVSIQYNTMIKLV